jgi:hypothetical protein
MDDRVTSIETSPADVATGAPASAVSWAAIVAGAVAAASTALLLGVLAAGIDLASLSPWPGSGASATSVAVMTAIGLIVIQWLSALIGGYIAGRLRTKWVGTHTHEVFFRDTAHGFLTWALATVLALSVLASAGSSILGSTVHTASTMGAGLASTAANAAAPVGAYDLDLLFRSNSGASRPDSANESRAQVDRILTRGVLSGDLPAADRTYMAQTVAAQTGISADEAQHRVDDAIQRAKQAETKAREAADTARKAAALTSILTALSMLIGAFIASVAAALGGRLRDLHP